MKRVKFEQYKNVGALSSLQFEDAKRQALFCLGIHIGNFSFSQILKGERDVKLL